MEKKQLDLLKKRALTVREHIIKMTVDGGCFIGASLSCTDIIVYLYSNFLNISKDTYKDESRDYFFLSKGHDVPALYSTLSELGFFEPGRLKNHLKTNDFIYWHPNRMIPGIEFHSGSLGHLLSISIGVALDLKLKKMNNKVVVLLGDGELNEGSNWEAMLVAKAFSLNNLLIIIDRNQFQANMRTEKLLPLEPLEKKFESFGLLVNSVNGHDFQDIEECFSSLRFDTDAPNVIVADTIRGKGLPSIEERADRWFCSFTEVEVEMLLKELHDQKNISRLTSDVIIAR